MSLFQFGFSTYAALKRLRRVDACGDPVYAAPVPVTGRFEPGAARAVTEAGEEITPSAVFLSPVLLRRNFIAEHKITPVNRVDHAVADRF